MGMPQTEFFASSGAIHFIEMTQRIFHGSLYLATHYFILYVLPYPLSFDHPFPKPGFSLAAIISISFWILISFLAILYRKKKLPSFLAGWYLITLLPVFLLPGISTISLFQENRGYLSGVGIITLFALGIRKIGQILEKRFGKNGRRSFILSVISLIAIYSFISYYRNPAWKTEVTLWTDTLEKNPGSFIASFSLGYGYLTENNWDSAGEYFTRALELSPPKEYLYYIHNNLGAVYQYKDQMDNALREYELAANLSPGLPEAHLNLGQVYLKEGNYEKAEREMETAIDIEYHHMKQRVLGAIEMEEHGAAKEARRLFLKISEKAPHSPEYRELLELIAKHLYQEPLQSPEKRANTLPSFNKALNASNDNGL
jgi:tetratricopeptide (TPR) repeat protein